MEFVSTLVHFSFSLAMSPLPMLLAFPLLFLSFFLGNCVPQISLPQGVPMPPSVAEPPAPRPPAGPPAGPPAPIGGRVRPAGGGRGHLGNGARRPMPPVDLGNPSVSVCSGFGWTIHNGNCYKVVQGLMSWSQAMAACRAEDPTAHLVAIEDEADNRFIGQLISKDIARSLQLYHMATTLFNSFWIGLRRVKVGDHYQSTWVNGVPATFGNDPTVYAGPPMPNRYPWGSGQPSGTNKFTDPTGSKEECVHMFSADGQWNDAGCEIEMVGGVCQKSAQF